METYESIRNLGIVTNLEAQTFASAQDVMKFAKEWEEKRHDLPFNTDGLVIKINSRSLYQKLGVVGKNPRGAVAFKYPAEQATSKVIDIFISVGRTGAATPVAMLEPVVVAGSTVQMATLHNEGEVARKGIRIGDTVVVQKAGDIIPEIVEPITSLRNGSEKEFVMPKECPECGTKLVKAETEAVWRCPNPACPARVANQLQHYASKSALDIEGLGEKNVLALLESGLVKTAADLYRLTKAEVEGLDRFAEKSAQNLVDSIAEKTQPELHRFVYALGIRHVGVQTAVDLANNFKTLESLSEATIEDLQSVDGVGVVVAESIVAWFADPSNQQLLSDFRSLSVVPKKVDIKRGRLSGKAICVTGSLESMSREQAAEAIREEGGTFQTSVGSSTDYLVAGGKTGASKLKSAQKHGVEVIDESAFLNILGR
jgi:DNA ligase (NAD+)